MIPRTLLSMLFHGTIPRYRDEIHYNIDQSFERFAINDQAFARLEQKGLPSAVVVRAACHDVEVAAFKVRRRREGAKEELKAKSGVLFGYMAALLAAELASPVPQHDQPGRADPATNFLSNLYHLIYSQEVRKHGQSARQILDGMESATVPVMASWDFLLSAPRGRPIDFPIFYQHTQVLCAALTLEFSASIWPIVW